MDFKDRVVIVTGAGRGIGAALARAFAGQGASVVVNYLRQPESAGQVADECRRAGGDGLAVAADVRTADGARHLVAQALEVFGRLDVVVNNAFSPYTFDPEQRRRADELSWADYQAQFEGAVGAAHHMCQAALPALRQRSRGAIVNIATNLVEHPLVPYHDYATAKSALVGYSRNLAAELGPVGVRVNCVAPGLVYPTASTAATRAAFRESIAAATPLRRIARPEDIAGPVLFLASDWSAFMTGQVLFVDGGLVMK
ncbi:SDR family oxidoreductase [Ramlibacter sp. AW1]|uniref:SDR family oxidoreductase n=1 Tax=Ramlibacter aurantiacus TaxID=2801330 RepID=A0A936ZVP9_9BURK|nr:SDR family oxidoreductase [Ramlibacter aurantiacus]MBL0421995.1 SDR family oxidoreductase [Ramlibacter aurantiacus]